MGMSSEVVIFICEVLSHARSSTLMPLRATEHGQPGLAEVGTGGRVGRSIGASQAFHFHLYQCAAHVSLQWPTQAWDKPPVGSGLAQGQQRKKLGVAGSGLWTHGASGGKRVQAGWTLSLQWGHLWSVVDSESPWHLPGTPLAGPPSPHPEEVRRARGRRAHGGLCGQRPTTGCVCALAAYLLPNLLCDRIQLERQCVYLQGLFKLPLVAKQVAMETVPPSRDGVRLSLRYPSSPLSCPTISGSGTGLLLRWCRHWQMVLTCSGSLFLSCSDKSLMFLM